MGPQALLRNLGEKTGHLFMALLKLLDGACIVASHLRQGFKLFSNRRIVLSHLCLCRLEPLGELRIVAQDSRRIALQRIQACRQCKKLIR